MLLLESMVLCGNKHAHVIPMGHCIASYIITIMKIAKDFLLALHAIALSQLTS